MGKEIVYCEICGDRILEQEFEKGRAITLLNKNYCAKCKDEAVKSISAEDIPEEELNQARKERSSALMKAVRAELPTKTPPRGTPAKLNTPPRAPAMHRNTPRPGPAASGSKMPIIVGAAIGGVALLVLILMIASGGGGKENEDKGKSGSGTKGDPKAAEAEKAWNELQTIVQIAEKNGDWDAVITKIDAFSSQFAGSKYESLVGEIKGDATRKKKDQAAERAIQDLLNQAEQYAQGDDSFKNYSNVIKKYDEANDQAKLVPKLTAKVKEKRDGYLGLYNRKADDVWYAMKEEVLGWINQGMYKNAAAVIDARFEPHLRNSNVWKSDIEPKYKDCLEKAKAEKPNTGGGDNTGGGGGDEPQGEWVNFADLQRWGRLPQQGDKENNWSFGGGTFTGTSSYASGKENQFFDILVTQEVFGEFEMKFSARMKKGESVNVLFHITQSGTQATVSPLKLLLTSDWLECRLVMRNGNLKVVKGGTEKAFDSFSPGRDGVLGFALEPGSQVEIKDIQIRRWK